jgi:putative endonuclease
MNKYYFVYILSSDSYILYTGVTSNLQKRVFEHKEKTVKGFTEKYNISKLVYYEVHEDVNFAIQREKNIKKWKRQWKVKFIEKSNPNWKDLYYDL